MWLHNNRYPLHRHRPTVPMPRVPAHPLSSSKFSICEVHWQRLLLDQLMSRWPQPCSVCGTLTKGTSRCDAHEREYRIRRDRARQGRVDTARKSNLYNSAYRREAKLIRDNATHCHICQQPFVEGDRIEADHIIPGLEGSPLAPAHRLCNQRRGNKPL